MGFRDFLPQRTHPGELQLIVIEIFGKLREAGTGLGR